MASIKKTIEQITEAVINETKDLLKILPEDQVNEIIRRREICAQCPLQSENAKEEGWYESVLPYIHCTACKCDIGLKTACLSCNCGAENKGLEPKWKKYENKK